MTWVILAFFSHLVFIPSIYDGFSLPKRLYVFGLGVAAIYWLLREKKPLPFFPLIALYLGISLIPLLWLTNPALFVERLALDVACFALFWAVALSKVDEPKLIFVFLFSIWVIVLVLISSHFTFPSSGGVMGNIKYIAIVSAQVATLPLVMSTMGFFAASALMFLSLGSRTAFAAAFMALCFFVVLKKRIAPRPFKTFLSVIALAPAFVLILATTVSISDRDEVWRNSPKMLSGFHKLAFGIGKGQFETLYPAYVDRTKNVYHTGSVLKTKAGSIPIAPWGHPQSWTHPHNEFLALLIEGGLIGLTLFWSLIVLVLVKGDPGNPISAAIFCSLIVMLLVSTFWFPFTHPSMAATFWATAGLLCAYSRDFRRL